MAKTKNPLVALAASGRIGPLAIATNTTHASITKRAPHPPDLRSLAQLSWRTMFQKAVALWHSLSPTEKLSWERQATPLHMTGFSYFVSQALKPNPGIYLPLAGGIMTGPIDMGGNHLTTLPAPSSPDHAARYQDLTDHAALSTTIHSLKGPAYFQAYNSSPQTINFATTTKLAFNSTTYNYGSYWDTTNYQFKPLIPALYFISARCRLATISPGQYAQLYAYLNGNLLAILHAPYAGTTGAIHLIGNLIQYFNGTTDYLDFRVIHSHSPSMDTTSTYLATSALAHLISQT